MAEAVRSMGKETTIICPSEIDGHFHFMNGSKDIQTIDFTTFDFSPFDLFILLDSSSEEQISDQKNYSLSTIPRIVIDHHVTNVIEADVRLVEAEAAATAEIVFGIFKDWNHTITPDMATALFAGLATDTVYFKYSNNAERGFPDRSPTSLLPVLNGNSSFGTSITIIISMLFDY